MNTSRQRRSVVLLVQPSGDRAMYAEFLRARRLETLCPSPAINALRLASRADIIVTGVVLDETIDGIDLVSRLRANARTATIPIIVLTASTWNNERERAAAAGCDLFLSKPCLPDDLLRAVLRLVEATPRHRGHGRR